MNVLVYTLSMMLFAPSNAATTVEQPIAVEVIAEQATDPLEEQLAVAARLKELMAEKKYDEAIKLFSAKQQKAIKELNEEGFKFWCMGWSLKGEMYDYYVNKIKEGKAAFVLENDEWKIDEH